MNLIIQEKQLDIFSLGEPHGWWARKHDVNAPPHSVHLNWVSKRGSYETISWSILQVASSWNLMGRTTINTCYQSWSHSGVLSSSKSRIGECREAMFSSPWFSKRWLIRERISAGTGLRWAAIAFQSTSRNQGWLLIESTPWLPSLSFSSTWSNWHKIYVKILGKIPRNWRICIIKKIKNQ